jgi:hypothetical protein
MTCDQVDAAEMQMQIHLRNETGCREVKPSTHFERGACILLFTKDKGAENTTIVSREIPEA